jgi:hypothetical protein
MSLVIDAAGDYVTRTNGLPPNTGAFTICGHAKRTTDRGAYSWITYMIKGSAPTNDVGVRTDTDGDSLQGFVNEGTETPNIATITDTSWFFWAIVGNGSTITLYYQKEGGSWATPVTAAQTSFVPSNWYLGDTSVNTPFVGEIADVRMWSTALSASQLIAERASSTVVNTTSLLSNHPFKSATEATALSDSSGNGYTLTKVGTPSFTTAGPTYSTASTVIRCQLPAAAYNESGVTAYVWSASIASNLPAVTTGLSVSGTGALTIPGGSLSAGTSVNVLLVGAAGKGSALALETVEADTGGGETPLSLALGDATSISTTSGTLSCFVAGTIPSGAATQIQVAENPNTGPWTSSTTPSTSLGTFTHTFSGLSASTTYTYRAYVYDPNSTTIYAQTPPRTFTTGAIAGGGGGVGGSPDEPPATQSAQHVVDLMLAGPNGDDWVAGWGYPPNAYGGINQLGARLKHNANIYNLCGISPYQDMLPTLVLSWLTVSGRAPLPSNHNIAVEMVPRPMWARIRPDLNGGRIEWVQLNNPTGATTNGVIAPSGVTIGSWSETRNNGRVIRIPPNYILHPWAVVSGTQNLDAPITNLVSQNPADPYADSRVDCIVSTWWCRLVPWNVANPIGDITTNPIIVVHSADPYVGRPRFGITDDDCKAGIAANRPERLTTEWRQISFGTFTNTPDFHTTQPYAGIASSTFLASPRPPGYV